jgi:Cytochrome C oxidase, cbb3-type, subunit III
MSIRSAALLLFPALALVALAQDPVITKIPARQTSPVSGSEMYQAYCASCHGPKGLGDGPVAPYLKSALPDLTTLAKQNQGTFPAQRVAQVIRGEVSVKTHGVPEMTVWGPIFLSLDHSQEPMVRLRVSHLTKHIEGLQAK